MCARIFYGKNKRSSISSQLTEELHWLLANGIYKRAILKTMFKREHFKMSPTLIQNLFLEVPSDRPHRTRSTFKLIEPNAKSVSASRAFSVLGAKLWNQINNEEQCSNVFNKFSEQIHLTLLKQQQTQLQILN